MNNNGGVVALLGPRPLERFFEHVPDQLQRLPGLLGLPGLGELEAVFHRHRHYFVGGLGLFGIVAVICGICLSFTQPSGPPTIRHPSFPSTHTVPVPAPSSPGQQVAWLGAPIEVWQTAKEAGELINRKADVLFVPDFDFSGPVVNISSQRGQSISGFGGAFSEASARVFRELPLEQQEMVLEGYFGNEGIGYTLGRVDMTGDFVVGDFEGDWHRERRVQLPFVRDASKVLKRQGKQLQLLATQWSPPAWMKTNAKMFQPAHPCLRKMVSATWAEYFVEWISAYHKENLPIWAVTVQHASNEDARSEACLLTPEEEAQFLGHLLGPRLRAAHPDVRVFFSQHGQYTTRWADLLQSHPDAAGYAVGIAFQGSTEVDLEALQDVRTKMPNAQLLASEAVGLRKRWRWPKGATPATGDWSLGEGYAHDILGTLNAGSVGWIDWNLIINSETIGPNHVDNVWDAAMNLLVDDDEEGTEYEDNVWDAAMMADLSTGEVHRHPQYYFIGHISKFILPGSVHLKSEVVDTSEERSHNMRHSQKSQRRKWKRQQKSCDAKDGLQSTTFLRPDGLMATVVLNCGEQAVKFKIQHGARAAHANIPPHAIQTYLFESKGNSPFRDAGKPFIGVNLGGWLLCEEWMWASEMNDHGIRDEWTLIQRHGGPNDPRAIRLIEDHWDTFVTEADLDRLQDFGITHVRVPIGYWLVDYDVADGFVDGGERYLTRLLAWLQVRGMRAVLDLHALPGAQATHQSFTGKWKKAEFFTDRSYYNRGKRAMLKLARLILSYEYRRATAGVVVGIQLGNEPQWSFWDTSPGIREMYEEMVPAVRRLLPPQRYTILLNFMESPRITGSAWLGKMREADPTNYAWVVYDAHLYHSFGDDNKPGRTWNPKTDSCKTCCRDPEVMGPLVQNGVPIVVGEYSLNTGFPGDPTFYLEYFRNQLSLWASIPGMVGSFFWNHRIMRNPGGWYKEMSLLELLAPNGPLPPISQMNLTVRCPGKNLTRCPRFNPMKVLWTAECEWLGDEDVHTGMGNMHQLAREAGVRTFRSDLIG